METVISQEFATQDRMSKQNIIYMHISNYKGQSPKFLMWSRNSLPISYPYVTTFTPYHYYFFGFNFIIILPYSQMFP